MSTLDRAAMAPGSQPKTIIDVPARTLNSILAEAGAPQPIDFLSIDVEGHEIEVMLVLISFAGSRASSCWKTMWAIFENINS